jgi:hypothetical protein
VRCPGATRAVRPTHGQLRLSRDRPVRPGVGLPCRARPLRDGVLPGGEDGRPFLRDTLWRGEPGDGAHGRRLVRDALGIPVESVSSSELRTSEACPDDLDAFDAEAVTEVLKKYLESSVHVEHGQKGFTRNCPTSSSNGS